MVLRKKKKKKFIVQMNQIKEKHLPKSTILQADLIYCSLPSI